MVGSAEAGSFMRRGGRHPGVGMARLRAQTTRCACSHGTRDPSLNCGCSGGSPGSQKALHTEISAYSRKISVRKDPRSWRYAVAGQEPVGLPR